MRFAELGCAFASLVVVTACGSGDPVSPGTDGGAADGSSSDSAANDAATNDGSPSDGSPSDGSIADGGADTGVTATGSMPPAGSTLCGSGTFTPADSISVCQTSTPYFPPMYNVTKACGFAGFTFSSGLWEAWCTPSYTYLFARFDGAAGFELVPPTGNYQSGNGGGSANAYFDLSKKQIFVSAPNGQPSAKAGQLFLLRFDGNADGGVTNFTMVAGVALTWK